MMLSKRKSPAMSLTKKKTLEKPLVTSAFDNSKPKSINHRSKKRRRRRRSPQWATHVVSVRIKQKSRRDECHNDKVTVADEIIRALAGSRSLLMKPRVCIVTPRYYALVNAPPTSLLGIHRLLLIIRPCVILMDKVYTREYWFLFFSVPQGSAIRISDLVFFEISSVLFRTGFLRNFTVTPKMYKATAAK